MTVFPQKVRRPETAYGSATLAFSQRLAAGSVFTSDDIDVVRDDKKSFGFRASQGGSWTIQVAFAGTQQLFNYAEGTFPGGQGSITVRSFTEAARRARVQVRLRAVGSFSAYYGGYASRFR